jgi:hypothetical protein
MPDTQEKRDLEALADKFYRAADEAIDIVLDANAKAKAALEANDPKQARDYALTSDRGSRTAAKMVERLSDLEGGPALPTNFNFVAILQSLEKRGIVTVNPALLENGAGEHVDAESVRDD